MSHHEKRKAQRIKRRAAVIFESEGARRKGVIINCSEIGLFIQTEEPLPVGSEISIPTMAAAREKTELRGRVVWVERPNPKNPGRNGGIGVELDAAPQEYLQFVAKMRQQLLKAPRAIEERFEVYHRVRFKSGKQFLTEYTENLSRGGMFVASNKPLEPGSLIEAEIEVEGIEQPLKVEGRVAYRLDSEEAQKVGRSGGMGVQFVDLSPEVQARLHQYIQRLEIHRTHPKRRLVSSIPNSGILSDYLIPELLLYLILQKSTGTLVLQSQGITKLVYLKNGKPVYVESSLRTETLGEFLVRQGKITPQDLQESLEELAKSEIHHGEILVRGGMIDTATLATALVEHQEEKLCNTFTWFEGKFEFVSGTDWPPTISILPLRSYKIIFDGIQRWYDSALIKAWMGLTGETLIQREQLPMQDVPIPPRAFRILNATVTPQKIKKVAEVLDCSFEEILPTVYTLVIAGWLRLEFSRTEIEREEINTLTLDLDSESESEDFLKVLKRWLNEDFERLRSLNFYEILQIHSEASEVEIERAYRERLSRYSAHDIELIDDEEIRSKVSQICNWIQLARDTLLDSNLKTFYSRKASKVSSKRKNSSRIEAERFLLSCIRYLEQGQIDKAETSLKEGIERYPKNLTIAGYWGWALFQKNRRGNFDQAVKLLKQAIGSDPSDPHLHYFRGEVASYLGEWKEAEHHFSQAVRLYPKYVRAATALDFVRGKTRLG